MNLITDNPFRKTENLILYKVLKPLNEEDFLDINRIDKVLYALTDNIMKYNGLGLAANQVGYTERVFIIRGDDNSITAYFNPEIVSSSKKTLTMDEGCLSYPGYFCKIKRPVSISVKYRTFSGEEATEELTGMKARVFQHEIDHLDGMRFFDRASKYHLDQADRSYVKNIRKSPKHS